MRRNRRAGVEDRWRRADGKPTARAGTGLRWMARYVDDEGRERTRSFGRKVDAQSWLDEQTAAIVTGTHVSPRHARMTVNEWCDQWIKAYEVHRASTVRQAKTHIVHIKAEFGSRPLAEIRPSEVKVWIAKLQAACR